MSEEYEQLHNTESSVFRQEAGAAIRSRVQLAFEMRGLTQEEFALRMGSDQGTVQAWVGKGRKKAAPQARHLPGIVSALQISGHWLVTGEGPMAAPGAPAVDPYEQARAQVRAEMGAAIKAAVDAALGLTLDEQGLVNLRAVLLAAEASAQPPQPDQQASGQG